MREPIEWPSATFWAWVAIYGFLNLCAWLGASGRL